jgi:hypothetical protein
MKKYYLLIFTVFITLATFAQKQKSRATLEFEKKKNLQKISQVKKINEDWFACSKNCIRILIA